MALVLSASPNKGHLSTLRPNAAAKVVRVYLEGFCKFWLDGTGQKCFVLYSSELSGSKGPKWRGDLFLKRGGWGGG